MYTRLFSPEDPQFPMARLVMKFGGTSVGDVDRIRNVARHVKREVDAGHQVAVVVSAMAGKTNELVAWCRDASPLHDAREYDAVVASGEQVTAGLLAIVLEGIGVNARSWQGWQLPILTDNGHASARILDVNGAELVRRFNEHGQVAVIAGFQGLHKDTGRITTLGRGGSDTSAVAIAAAIGAERCDIYTDVDGVYTSDPRELDVVAATGEQVTIGLLAIDEVNMRADLDAGTIVIVAGFQGVDSEGNITTLGRGGSDTSGVALAAALTADECQIYTDVDGVYTTDPRIVPEARRLDRVTFEEMLEMASLGSKVLQIRSVEFAGKYKVKLRVLSSFEDPEVTSPGTLITFEEQENMEQAIISGIAFTRDEAKISVMGVEDKPGIAYAILGPIADANIDVDMIVQNIGASGHTDFSFTVNRTEYQKALDVLARERGKVFKAREIIGDNRICKVSVVGIGMRSHVGLASKMFKTLADEGINIQMISTSEIKISIVIDEKYLELAVRVLHRAFGLDTPPKAA